LGRTLHFSWELIQRHKKIVIVLDEISWMGSEDPDFLGKLKTAWDLQFSENPNLIMIIFEDKASGARDNRPGLANALAFLKPGDVLVVWKLDRLGRSLTHRVERPL